MVKPETVENLPEILTSSNNTFQKVNYDEKGKFMVQYFREKIDDSVSLEDEFEYLRTNCIAVKKEILQPSVGLANKRNPQIIGKIKLMDRDTRNLYFGVNFSIEKNSEGNIIVTIITE